MNKDDALFGQKHIDRLDEDQQGVADNSSSEKMEFEELADLYAKELRGWTNTNKIQPLKQLANIGGLKHLKYVLPISQYSSEFIRKLARYTAVQIILRTLRRDEGSHELEIGEKRKFVDLLIRLDYRYKYLEKFDLEDTRITQVIFDILSRENSEFTARKLSEIIVDSDEHMRASAIKIIAEILNKSETNLLIKLLQDPDARVRANVIEAFETNGDPNVTGILLRYKSDKDERVRANTIKALWNLGYREVGNALSEMLLHPEPKMQARATWVIGQIGHNQPEIKKLLRIVEHSEDPLVRLNLARAKKQIAIRERKLRVLIIDDDKKFLHEIFRQMARDGYHILTAFDGNAGISSAVKQRPEIILLDLHIPVKNGLAVLKEIKEQTEIKDTPVIVTCEVKLKGLLKKAKQAGAYDYLIKPFSYDELTEKLEPFI